MGIICVNYGPPNITRQQVMLQITINVSVLHLILA